jgi:hypothetical protein
MFTISDISLLMSVIIMAVEITFVEMCADCDVQYRHLANRIKIFSPAVGGFVGKHQGEGVS